MKKYEAPICDLLVWSASDVLMLSGEGTFYSLRNDIFGTLDIFSKANAASANTVTYDLF